MLIFMVVYLTFLRFKTGRWLWSKKSARSAKVEPAHISIKAKPKKSSPLVNSGRKTKADLSGYIEHDEVEPPPPIKLPKAKKEKRHALIVLIDWDLKRGAHFKLPFSEILKSNYPHHKVIMPDHGRPRFIYASLFGGSTLILVATMAYVGISVATGALGSTPMVLAVILGILFMLPMMVLGWILAPLPDPLVIVARKRVTEDLAAQVGRLAGGPAALTLKANDIALLPIGPQEAYRFDNIQIPYKDDKGREHMVWTKKVIPPATYTRVAEQMKDEKEGLQTIKRGIEKYQTWLLVACIGILAIVTFLLVALNNKTPDTAATVTADQAQQTATAGGQ